MTGTIITMKRRQCWMDGVWISKASWKVWWDTMITQEERSRRESIFDDIYMDENQCRHVNENHMTSNLVHIYEIRTIVCNCVYIFSLFCGEACAFNPIVLHHDRCCRKCQGLDAVLLSCRSVALGREVKVCNWIIRIIIFRLSFRLVLETDNLGHKLAASLFRRGCILSLVSVAWIATKLCVCLGCQHICLAIS
jgi:hypothetical protein